MKTSLNCPQGHTWQIEPSANGATHACPTCGAAAVEPAEQTATARPDPFRTVAPTPADPRDAATIAPSDAATTGEWRGSSPSRVTPAGASGNCTRFQPTSRRSGSRIATLKTHARKRICGYLAFCWAAWGSRRRCARPRIFTVGMAVGRAAETNMPRRASMRKPDVNAAEPRRNLIRVAGLLLPLIRRGK
jgi:hypothetical protein